VKSTGPQKGDAIVRRTTDGFVAILRGDVDLRSGPMPYKLAEQTARDYATGRIWVDIDGFPVLITL
jgi:hypothetical protein